MPDCLTLVINLDGSDDRLKSVTRGLLSEGMTFERISGVDARGKAPQSFPEYDGDGAKRFFGRPLTGGEVGCYLSHIRAAERFLRSDADYGLVLEDDVNVPHGISRRLDRLLDWLASRPELNWDVINLGKKPKHTTRHLADMDGVALVRAYYFPSSTTAILWSRPGAQRFLEAHDKILAPVDHFLRHWTARRGRGLAISPPLLVPTGAESVIDAEGTDGMARRKTVGKPRQFVWREFLRQGGNYVHALWRYFADRP